MKRKVSWKKKLIREEIKSLVTAQTVKLLSFANTNLSGQNPAGGTYASSYTNKCQWRGMMALAPSDLDTVAKTALNVANTNTVEADRAFLLVRARVKCVIRNNGSNTACIKMYKLTARKDFIGPSAEAKFAPSIVGNNPSIISNTTWPEIADQTTVEDYREIDYLPYDNTLLCSYFKVKEGPVIRLEPGQEMTMKLPIYKRFVGSRVTKQMFRCLDGDALANGWVYHRICGPVFLMKVQGCLAHNEDLISLASSNLDNTSLEPRYGPFNLDIAFHKRITVATLPVDDYYKHGRASGYPMPATSNFATGEKHWQTTGPIEEDANP